MTTYPLEERYVLLVTKPVAAAIQLQSAMECGPMSDIPKSVQAALAKGRAPWDVASDPCLQKILYGAGFGDVSDAHGILESHSIESMVCCMEFTGTASPSSGFQAGAPGSTFSSACIAMLVPERPLELFKAAYKGPQELISEYERRLGSYVGPGFPYERHICDVSGVYVC